jgi:hypothetical protein
MRIAFLADPASPNGWYRGIGPMIALAQRGHEVRQVWPSADVFRPELVKGCDVLHIHRQHDERALRIVRHAHDNGIAIVWDNDDDMRAIPRNNAYHREYGGLSGARIEGAIKRVLSVAQLVMTPSAVLAEKFAGLGARRVEVVENYVRDESAQRRRPDDGSTVTIGWLAGQEHHLDVERLPIADALRRLLSAHERVRVVSIGVGMGLGDARYRHVPRLPFAQLDDELVNFDVGLAPIADIPFNRARSNIKLKEYAVLGATWLASPVGPYVAMGEREGGRLVPDDGWHEALERIVVKDRERRKLAKRAAKWGRAQTQSANAGIWERLLTEAVERAASQRGAPS